MNTNLKNNVTLKQELKFNPNGKFKILMLSDIQETLDYDKRTLTGINQLIETQKPDFVLLGGDFCGIKMCLDACSFLQSLWNRRIKSRKNIRN